MQAVAVREERCEDVRRYQRWISDVWTENTTFSCGPVSLQYNNKNILEMTKSNIFACIYVYLYISTYICSVYVI